MADYIDISPHNAYRFVPKNLPKNPAWNGIDPYYDWLIKSYLDNQVKRCCFIPVNRTDTSVVIVKSSAGGALPITITDPLGTILATVYPYDTIVSGDLDPDGDPFHTLVYQFNMYGLLGVDGFYYIQIPNGAKDDGFGDISEPINLRREHKHTLLLKYRNSTIKDSTLYYYPVGPTPELYFYKRINGILGNRKSTSDTASYRGQGLSYYKPYDQNYTGLTATFGYYSGGIPDYDIDILGYIFSCDDVSIDRIKVARADGAELSKNFPDNYPIGSATIEVVPTDPQQARLRKVNTTVVIYAPTSEPYDLRSFGLNGDTPINFTRKTPIYGQPDRYNLLDYLNGQFALENNLQGYFSFIGTALNYTNAPSEYINSANNAVIWYKPLRLTLGTPLVSNFAFTYTAATNPFDVVTYDSGAKVLMAVTMTSGTFTQTYPPNTLTAYLDIFGHPTSSLKSFINTTGFEKAITNISGYAPVGLLQFQISNFFWPVANLNFLSSTLATMKSIELIAGNIISLDVSVITPSGTGGQLNDFRVNNNKLSSANIDAILIALATPGLLAASSTIILNNQSPAAPPTSASATARAYILAHGATITTD